MNYCKYCKKKNHTIDNCTEIMCKSCKEYGHPHWKCKNKKETIKENKTVIKREQSINEILQYKNMKWGDI